MMARLNSGVGSTMGMRMAGSRRLSARPHGVFEEFPEFGFGRQDVGHPARLDGGLGVWLMTSVFLVAALDVALDEVLEFAGGIVALQATVFCHPRRPAPTGFAGAGKGNTDVGVLRFAGGVDDAAHDRQGHVLDAVIVLEAPFRHLAAHEILHSPASSWNKVLVVRPQPGQAATIG